MDSARQMPIGALPEDYAERVYAGVLGKLIGVYLGRPFEGWTNERIERELGDITDYVHDRLVKRLLVTDDDISGTLTFVRAFEDCGDSFDIPARDIGQSWLKTDPGELRIRPLRRWLPHGAEPRAHRHGSPVCRRRLPGRYPTSAGTRFLRWVYSYVVPARPGRWCATLAGAVRPTSVWLAHREAACGATRGSMA